MVLSGTALQSDFVSHKRCTLSLSPDCLYYVILCTFTNSLDNVANTGILCTDISDPFNKSNCELFNKMLIDNISWEVFYNQVDVESAYQTFLLQFCILPLLPISQTYVV